LPEASKSIILQANPTINNTKDIKTKDRPESDENFYIFTIVLLPCFLWAFAYGKRKFEKVETDDTDDDL
jgi:hypothetical protein